MKWTRGDPDCPCTYLLALYSPTMEPNFLVFFILQGFVLLFATGDNAVCQTPLYWSGTQNVTIFVGSNQRLFQLYIPWQERSGPQFQCGSEGTPQKYCTGPPVEPAPLVINWHGCNAHGPIIDYHTEISQVNNEAADRGYVAITPLGTVSPSIQKNHGE